MLHAMFSAEKYEENGSLSIFLSFGDISCLGLTNNILSLFLFFFCRSKATTIVDVNGLKSLSGNKVFI